MAGNKSCVAQAWLVRLIVRYFEARLLRCANLPQCLAFNELDRDLDFPIIPIS